jgi:hypothetical protein
VRRASVTARASAYVRARAFPRLEMSAIVAVATGSAVGTSALLRALGLHALAVRYPIAVLAGYLAFLGAVGLWRRFHHPAPERRSNVDLDPTSLVPDGLPSLDVGGGGAVDAPFGGGGGFAGGGSSGSWSEGAGADALPVSSASSASSAGSSGSGGSGLNLGSLDVGGDGEGCLLVIVAAVCIAVALAAGGYLVWIAPDLLVELVADAAIAARLVRGLPAAEGDRWVRIVLRRTWWIAAIAAVTFGFAGHVTQQVVPTATSFGEAWRTVNAPRPAPAP